ncbi:UPF0598 protein CG30010 [Contarinia nasturtii]|uniref:UPF0598 protein CG30010 n=1 Tax=Contarinia nasturtii TaxID=265458 RepID=UPI0012D43866|nr:UPF0598 protein CG30010 [Contarinia nasturtii]
MCCRYFHIERRIFIEKTFYFILKLGFLSEMFRYLKCNSNKLAFQFCTQRNYCKSLYIQGQRVDNKIREYFYYIDHDGMLFLDDARIKNFTSCFKEKHFIRFFFKRLRFNTTNRYQNEFPYLSLCGTERNYIRCDDLPIVFTDVISNDQENCLAYNHGGNELKMQFQPDKVYMSPESGRVYHPADGQYGFIGLIRSKMAIAFSKHFEFEQGEQAPPTHFTWNNTRYILENDWLKDIKLPEGRKYL